MFELEDKCDYHFDQKFHEESDGDNLQILSISTETRTKH